MRRSNFYDLLGIPTYASHAEIAVAVRERLAVTWGDERELLINAANTLLDRESRESYDRLNGIVREKGKAGIAADNAAELAKFAESERMQRTDSAFTELKWTLNLIVAGIGIGVWLLVMYQWIPSVSVELNKVLVWMTDFTPVVAGILLTLPALAIGFVGMNLFSETLHITIRYLIVCVLLGIFISGLGLDLLASEAGICVRLMGLIALVVGSVMFVRYLGVRQLRSIGEVRPTPSNRRDQHK